jgi:hypothetical protein
MLNFSGICLSFRGTFSFRSGFTWAKDVPSYIGEIKQIAKMHIKSCILKNRE